MNLYNRYSSLIPDPRISKLKFNVRAIDPACVYTNRKGARSPVKQKLVRAHGNDFSREILATSLRGSRCLEYEIEIVTPDKLSWHFRILTREWDPARCCGAILSADINDFTVWGGNQSRHRNSPDCPRKRSSRSLRQQLIPSFYLCRLFSLLFFSYYAISSPAFLRTSFVFCFFSFCYPPRDCSGMLISIIFFILLCFYTLLFLKTFFPVEFRLLPPRRRSF